MSTVVNLGSKTAAVLRKWRNWLGIALLVSLGLAAKLRLKPPRKTWARLNVW